MEYTVVIKANPDEFIKSVTQHLQDDWEVQGGLVIFKHFAPETPPSANLPTDEIMEALYFAQAMTRVLD